MLSCHLSRYHGAVLQCMSLLRKMVSSSPVGASQAVLRMAAGERHEFLRSSSIARRDRRRLLRVNQSQSREVTARRLQCEMPGSTRSRGHQISPWTLDSSGRGIQRAVKRAVQAQAEWFGPRLLVSAPGQRTAKWAEHACVGARSVLPRRSPGFAVPGDHWSVLGR